jgi:hypothetical protein
VVPNLVGDRVVGDDQIALITGKPRATAGVLGQ